MTHVPRRETNNNNDKKREGRSNNGESFLPSVPLERSGGANILLSLSLNENAASFEIYIFSLLFLTSPEKREREEERKEEEREERTTIFSRERHERKKTEKRKKTAHKLYPTPERVQENR